MITVKEDTTLVGISELRTHFARVLEVLGHSKVLLERRNKPLAVIVPIEKYARMEELLELVEEAGLGYLAREREQKSRPSDYLDLDKAEGLIRAK